MFCPKKRLRTVDAVALIVGIVIGAGIFRTPSLVAANVGSGVEIILVWVIGGLVSLIGALCYAELVSTFPNTGGDYYFLRLAFGKRIAFLFAWARMTVIQTGSIALLAFIFGDYASQIYSLGKFSAVIYAASVVLFLTAINIAGIRKGTETQKLLTVVEVLGLALVIVVGFFFVPEAEFSILPDSHPSSDNSMGLAMVFVLLTFGGWNEAAYISAEMRFGQRSVVKALMMSIVLITVIYLLVNLALLNALGQVGMSGSDAVAVDLMRLAFGKWGVLMISALVAISALASANATIFTGARSNYAMGRDFAGFKLIGDWKVKNSVPVNAFLLQGVISLILIGMGLFTRSGFETMVEYTAPVFWFFLLLVGLSLFILRRKEPEAIRPFRVPFFPLLPIGFCMTSLYLLYSSIVYTSWGAFLGIAVLGLGLLLQFINPSLLEDIGNGSE
ncbi:MULTISPECIES: APC family permease [Rhodonellum]|uniref:Amino acid/polyamine/organocation transporter, APC superfamily n=1 Tax=Rhodonellum ikkaensis TaxID=336829 RepID=A0A1H3U2M3_9BACT|nr:MULTISPECIES: amino acid permease [Rhodonellum]SDZ56716.1 amino acid/polyamine/organocation transporter, APC superfamily [Rhodonellum ikkaensis]